LFLNNLVMDPLVSVSYQSDILSEFYVGGFNAKIINDYAGSFKGSLANINYYNKALSPSQIKDLYDNNGWICELDQEQEYSNYVGTCGNGKVDDNEACDNGISNGITCVPGAGETCSYCTWDCRVVINDVPYQSDLSKLCGNGMVEGTEECDDGNDRSDDGCDGSCVIEYCGDGVDNNNIEECDDGNPTPDDGCDNCAVPVCGDSIINGVEECDDGNVISDDGCSNVCVVDYYCGDGVVQTYLGEECDDANTVSNDACDNCHDVICGDGIINGGETCDDGNTDATDGCDGCLAVCGNGFVERPTEVCELLDHSYDYTHIANLVQSGLTDSGQMCGDEWPENHYVQYACIACEAQNTGRACYCSPDGPDDAMCQVCEDCSNLFFTFEW